MGKNTNTMVFGFQPDDLPWQEARILFEWWQHARKDRKYPSRKDFNPFDFHSALPMLVLVDVSHDPITFKMRLIGTAVVEYLGEKTGVNLLNIKGGKATHDRYLKLLEVGDPYFATDLPLSWAESDWKSYNILNLPLSNDGKHIDMFITLVQFQ